MSNTTTKHRHLSLQGAYDNALRQVANKKILELAGSQYGFKSKLEEYRPLLRITKPARWLFAGFSILTGAGWLYYRLLPVLPSITVELGGVPVNLMALVLGLGIFICYELLKGELSQIAFKQVFKNGLNGITGFLLVTALLFYAGSVYASLAGISDLYSGIKARPEVEGFLSKSDAQKQTITAQYDAKIRAETQGLNAFKESVTWKGKINMYNKSTANTINGYNTRINNLNEQKASELAAHSQSSGDELSRIKAENSYNAAAWVWLSTANELLIFACILFGAWYFYTVHNEKELLQQFTGINESDFSSLLQNFAAHFTGGQQLAAAQYQTYGGQEQEEPKPKTIGFDSRDSEKFKPEFKPGLKPEHDFEGESEEKPRENTRIKSPTLDLKRSQQKLEGYLEKYPEAVAATLKGESVKECMRKYNISRSTMQNIRRCLRYLQD